MIADESQDGGRFTATSCTQDYKDHTQLDGTSSPTEQPRSPRSRNIGTGPADASQAKPRGSTYVCFSGKRRRSRGSMGQTQDSVTF